MISPMTSIISHIQIANAALCLLMALQLLAMSAMRPIPKRLLGLNYLMYAHQSIALVAILNAHPLGFSISRPLFAMLLGPILYVYFLSVRRHDSPLQIKDALHFIGGVAIILMINLIKPLRAFIDIAIITSFVVYFSLIAMQMRRGQQALAHLGSFAPSAFRWLGSLMIMAFINIVLEIAVNIEMASGTDLRDSYSLLAASIGFFLINTSTMLAALQRSDWLEWMYRFGEQALQVLPTGLDDEFANKLFERWENLVKTETLYKLEFGITIAQAARKLQVPARQLSNAVNQVYGNSFSVYMNDQRIQEAQRLLLEKPEMTVIEVMQESGFSSKSNFNKEFLRVSGMSPSAYRDAKGRNVEQ